MIKVDGIRDFVMSREQPEGGFSFAKTTPATLEDTYYALRILKELGFSYDNKKTYRYIEQTELDNLGYRQLFEALFLIREFWLTYDGDLVEKRLERKEKMSIDALYYKFQSLKLIMHENNIMKEEKDFISSKGIADLKYISEVSRQVILLKRLGIQFNEKEYSLWIQGCQQSDGGFGFNHKSSSYMENCYYALIALHELKCLPKDIEACKSFILYCKSESGAFGRQILAVPTLEATFYGLECLKILAEDR